jgi:toxin ParE1/3/4
MQFTITPAADKDLEDLAVDFTLWSLELSVRFRLAIEKTFDYIHDYAIAGALRFADRGRMRDLRSWPVPGFRKYIVFYRVTEEEITIVRILHGARDYYGMDWPDPR